MKKSIIRAVSALMGLGLVVAATSCQNAAAPAKVENVKASELTCAEGTSVTKDNAESILKALLKDDGISGMFSVKSTSEDVSNVELAKIALNMTRAASEEDPFEKIDAALEKFEKDFSTTGKGSLSINESIVLKDEDVGLGKANGNAVVKANMSVKDSSTKLDANATMDDLLNATLSYSAKGDAYTKLSADVAVDKDVDSLITAAKVNTIAKASVSGSVSGKLSEAGKITVKGSAAASDSASFGMAFKTDEGVVGKAIATVTVSAKVTGDSINDIVTKAMAGKMKSADIEKAINDFLKVSLSVKVYDTDNGVVFNESFDSAAALEEWMGAKK